MAIWRRLKAVLGLGSLWALPAACVGAIGGVISTLAFGTPLLPSLGWGVTTMGGLFLGLGVGFATLLTLTEGRRTLSELGALRAGAWGALAGGGLMAVVQAVALATDPGLGGLDPDTLSAMVSGIATFGALGGVLSAASVRLAREVPELPPGQAPPALPPD